MFTPYQKPRTTIIEAADIVYISVKECVTELTVAHDQHQDKEDISVTEDYALYDKSKSPLACTTTHNFKLSSTSSSYAQEAASRSASAAIRVQQAAQPASSLKQRPPLGRTTVSKEEEGRQARAAERQMRTAAAERRIAALNPLMATTPAATPPQLAAVPSNSGSGATDVLCTCCNLSLAGKVPFHRYNYRYCSTSCMYIHKQNAGG